MNVTKTEYHDCHKNKQNQKKKKKTEYRYYHKNSEYRFCHKAIRDKLRLRNHDKYFTHIIGLKTSEGHQIKSDHLAKLRPKLTSKNVRNQTINLDISLKSLPRTEFISPCLNLKLEFNVKLEIIFLILERKYVHKNAILEHEDYQRCIEDSFYTLHRHH